MIFLLACVVPAPEIPSCDPRVLEQGEVRIRRVSCGEELISGGEGRVGDYLLENALARYLVRGPYAALTRLEGPGGTLVDAAARGQQDMLLELLPDGDRSEVLGMEADPGEVRLLLPEVTYRLGVDDPVLTIQAEGGDFQGIAGYERTGATLRGWGFVGADATIVEDRGGYARLEGEIRVSVDREALWDQPVEGEADADNILVQRGEEPLLRLPVSEGRYSGRLPAGVSLQGERPGCAYEGTQLRECGNLKLRLVDPEGDPLTGILSDGQQQWRVPRGGGTIAVGPEPRRLHLWAGPSYSTAELDYPGGEQQRVVTLVSGVDRSLRAQAELALVAAPDRSSDLSSYDQLELAGGRNSDFVVILAQDEVPGLPGALRDLPMAQPGSSAGGQLWSWPWYGNPKKPAHGAVRWPGLDPLDLLSVSEGKAAERRITVVTAAWVEKAMATLSPWLWDPLPDALYLESLEDLPAYLALLDTHVAVAPVGPTTWLGLEADRNIPAFEKAIVEGWTVAGNGPALSLRVAPAPLGGSLGVELRVEAPPWLGVEELSLWTPAGELPLQPGADGLARTQIPVATAWVFATAKGRPVRDFWVGDQSWAVSGVLWLQNPG